MDAIKTGSLIAQARREKNMTQKELSELLHVTDRAVSKWERGLSFPDVSLLEPLAGALGLTLTELLDGERAAFAPETDERPLREILQLSGAALRKKSTKLKLLSAAAGILALILLGMGVYRIWNAPSRPAHASTLEKISLSENEQMIAQLSTSTVCKYRYTLTDDVKAVRAVYEVWSEDGKTDEGTLWEQDAKESPLTYRGTFLLGFSPGPAFRYDGKEPDEPHAQLNWLLPSCVIIGQSVPLPQETPGLVLSHTLDAAHAAEGDSALLLLLYCKNENSFLASETDALASHAGTARRGMAPPVPPGGYTVAIWLELEYAA